MISRRIQAIVSAIICFLLLVISVQNLGAISLPQEWSPNVVRSMVQIVQNVEPIAYAGLHIQPSARLERAWQANRHPVVNLLDCLVASGLKHIAIRIYESFWEDPTLLTKWTGYRWGTAPATAEEAKVYEKVQKLEKAQWVHRAHLFLKSFNEEPQNRIDILKETIKQCDSADHNLSQQFMAFLRAPYMVQHSIQQNDDDMRDILDRFLITRAQSKIYTGYDDEEDFRNIVRNEFRRKSNYHKIDMEQCCGTVDEIFAFAAGYNSPRKEELFLNAVNQILDIDYMFGPAYESEEDEFEEGPSREIRLAPVYEGEGDDSKEENPSQKNLFNAAKSWACDGSSGSTASRNLRSSVALTRQKTEHRVVRP